LRFGLRLAVCRIDGQRLGAIRPQLRDWFLEECARCKVNGKIGPARDQLVAKARALLTI